MKKSLILLFVAVMFAGGEAFAWGRVGHTAIAYIAECHLTPKTQKTIAQYLDHPIVYYATWMDENRRTAAYGFTTHWHVASVDSTLHYTPKGDGDAVRLLESAIQTLQNYRSQDDSTVAVNLKYIIHLVGDMHCPVHINYPNHRGFSVTFGGERMSYHAVWDEYVVASRHTWGYMEWQHELDKATPKQIAQIQSGSPRDWEHESAVYCEKIYSLASPNQTFDDAARNDFLNAAQPIAEHQILYAGYRLAAVLNALFD